MQGVQNPRKDGLGGQPAAERLCLPQAGGRLPQAAAAGDGTGHAARHAAALCQRHQGDYCEGVLNDKGGAMLNVNAIKESN